MTSRSAFRSDPRRRTPPASPTPSSCASKRESRCACSAMSRLRNCLVAQKLWSKVDKEQLAAECHERVDAAADVYLATAPRRPETMFDHLYADLPEAYAAQRRELAGEHDA